MVCCHLTLLEPCYERDIPSRTVESDKWGWKHVSVHGGFDKGSGTKRWKCNHCNQRYNGSYSRVRAHLLGFSGAGIKTCPAIETSCRDTLRALEEERQTRKKKNTSSKNVKPNLLSPHKTFSKEDVDEALARFFYADGLNLNIVNSPYFLEMIKAFGAYGQRYEPPSVENLSDFSLTKEKARIERSINLVKESWAHTGCTILCVNRLDCLISCFCINFFVASPRGVMFLRTMDVNEREGADSLFISLLSDTIHEIGPANVVQVITHLGQASFAFESVIVSKFPGIFWSHCASHSILMLMEEIAEIDWIKNVLFCARGFDQQLSAYQNDNSSSIIADSKECYNPLAMKFSPYGIVHKICAMKQALQEIVISNEWKQWKLSLPGDSITYDASILDEEFWVRARLALELFEPFLTLISALDIEKSVMGDVYNWRVESLKALRIKGIDDIVLNQLEQLIETRWDSLFSPLHAAGYILNPKFFGKGQNKEKSVMFGWKAVLERYESDSEARQTLREELSSYWRLEGSFGEEDAVEFRDKMDPVAWWENFGFETPSLQTLAIKILSQISSVSMCEGSWMCRESAKDLGVKRVEDLLFVQNNLRLQGQKLGSDSYGCSSGLRNGSSCCKAV